ncbi:MAG: hypothetical protein JWM11_1106 [Planctomycetaceae bacterium]|nr:hypothetical protein [Planctomycetaceae bacterium]
MTRKSRHPASSFARTHPALQAKVWSLIDQTGVSRRGDSDLTREDPSAGNLVVADHLVGAAVGGASLDPFPRAGSPG